MLIPGILPTRLSCPFMTVLRSPLALIQRDIAVGVNYMHTALMTPHSIALPDGGRKKSNDEIGMGGFKRYNAPMYFRYVPSRDGVKGRQTFLSFGCGPTERRGVSRGGALDKRDSSIKNGRGFRCFDCATDLMRVRDKSKRLSRYDAPLLHPLHVRDHFSKEDETSSSTL